MSHGAYSKIVKKKYSDARTREGKALQAIMKAIEKDIGKPFDARQSLLMSLIRSKVVIIMQIGKYLESIPEIVDYDSGKVPYVVDRTFFTASSSLRSALNELYGDRCRGKKGGMTYEDVIESIRAKEAARTAPELRDPK